LRRKILTRFPERDGSRKPRAGRSLPLPRPASPGNGLPTFSDLSISAPGVGYTLHAHVGGGLPDFDSDPFTITM
jgi:hypothetical protein